MAAEWQNSPDADVILRASGGKEFYTHKIVLSLASPVFRDMFSAPKLSPTEPSQIPIIDVDDPPKALEAFLQIIYPAREPLIENIETLVSVLRLADKYGAKDALAIHKHHLPSMYSNSPPIQIYAILCACGREEEAGAAARRVPFESLKTLDSNPILQLITTTQYQRLVSFMTVRDQKMREIVRRHHKSIMVNNRPCNNDLAHQLYSTTIATSLQAAFETNPCVQVTEALGIVSSASPTFPPCGNRCRYDILGLRTYAEELLKELVRMVENLPWGDQRASS
jgi:hypothetical protein